MKKEKKILRKSTGCPKTACVYLMTNCNCGCQTSCAPYQEDYYPQKAHNFESNSMYFNAIVV